MNIPIEHRGPEGANFWRRARWIAIAAILVLPFLAMQWTDEVTWTAADFAVAGILLVGANILYELAARRMADRKYRIIVGSIIVAAVLIIWAEGAIGIF